MTERGLVDVPDASARFLVDRRPGVPGSAVAAVLEGARPILVEVQALVMRTGAPVPRRSAAGMESGRLAMLLAVLERHAGVKSTSADVYASVAGGLRVTERGLDLAVALAVAGAQLGAAVTRDTVVIGELGLGGEVRSVPQLERRLARSDAAGFHAGGRPEGRARPRRARRPGGGAGQQRGSRSGAGVDPGRVTPGEPGDGLGYLGRLAEHREPRGRGRRRARPTAIGSHDARPPTGGAGDAAARGPRPHPAGAHGRADRRGRRARGALGVLRRLPARCRVHTATSVGAGEDGRRDHPRVRHVAGRPRQRAPRPRPQRAHLGDRHPPPHRRARRPPARRAGAHGVGGHVAGRHPPAGREAHARAHPAGARPRRPGAPDPRAGTSPGSMR